MGISGLIKEVKEDKEKFGLLECEMEPLIRKYVKKLYKDDKEETYAELIAALWEAVCRIGSYEDDIKVKAYLNNAVKYKFLELYKESCKYNNNTLVVEEEELNKKESFDHSYLDVVIMEGMERIRKRLNGKKRRIFELIFYREYTDSQTASELGVSRQYVHQVKKSLCKMIEREVLSIL